MNHPDEPVKIFATIHFKSDDRPDGYSSSEVGKINDDLDLENKFSASINSKIKFLNKMTFALKQIGNEIESTLTINLKDCLNDCFENLPNDYFCIYVIKLKNKSAENIKECFEKHKTNNNNVNYSRFNKRHNSNVLYVGKSKKLKDRIKQHFAKVPTKTYSLYLKNWVDIEDIEFEITHFNLKGFEESVVQFAEDALSETLKPIFGKRGGT